MVFVQHVGQIDNRFSAPFFVLKAIEWK